MNNSALRPLPVEILESIIEEITFHYKDAPSIMSGRIKFVPQWYLTPLLRVCKLWHVGLGENPVSKHIRREKIHSREDSKNRKALGSDSPTGGI